tara:strand:+ start:268 stop:486 length:219 start_codon:yes stop_codon:yes gene_type:complete
MDVTIHNVTEIKSETIHHKDSSGDGWFSCVLVSVTSTDRWTDETSKNDLRLYLPYGQTLETITTETKEKDCK